MKKMELMRCLTDEEVESIVQKYGKLSFIQKKGVIREANSGLKSIDSLYTLYHDSDLELDKDKYDFLVLSIANASKELSDLDNYISKMKDSNEQMSDIYNYGLMRLIAIKQKYGFSTEEYASFIDRNRDLYNELVKPNKKTNK